MMSNVMEWQAIDTVPKDGTYIVLARFVKGCPCTRFGYAAVDKYYSFKTGGRWDGFGEFNAIYWPPTHWMPLPAPPVQS
jgi:hypothetical protein